MLKRVKGDLLKLAEQGEFDVIIQGCNCFNTMGGGIARTIAQKYPQAALADKSTVSGDYNKLGNYTSWASPKFIIVNAYTQYLMSTGEDVFEYEAFALILKKLQLRYGGVKYGLPYIGMGLARGDANRIIPIIENFANSVEKIGGEVTLVEFG